MALRNQPYIPLYVNDFVTDEKLMECSAESTGVYIRLMCILHKQEEYGTILLKQKYMQNGKQNKNFAHMFAKQMPYSAEIIERSLDELEQEGVITVSENCLSQKRMVKDGKLSDTRSKAGSVRWKKGFAYAKPKANAYAKPQANITANIEANTEYDNDNDIDNEYDRNYVDPKKEEKIQECFLTDQEGRSLQAGFNSVLDAAEDVGIPLKGADIVKANGLIAEYTAPWVLEAVKRTVEAPESARCWRYVGGILKKWRKNGGIDSGGEGGQADDYKLPYGLKHVVFPEGYTSEGYDSG